LKSLMRLFNMSLAASLFWTAGDALAAKATIVILDFETNGVAKPAGSGCADAVRRTIVGTDRYYVVVRDKMEEILKEQGLQITGCTTTKCAVTQGKLLGARLVVFGSVSKVGSLYKVDLRIVDVELGTAIGAKDADVKYESGLEDAAARAALDLLGDVPQVGKIVEVDGRYYYVDLGRADGVTADSILKVVRRGAPVYNDEGEPILQKREEIGYLWVTTLDESGCETEVANVEGLEQLGTPATGDSVFITDFSRRTVVIKDTETGVLFHWGFYAAGGYMLAPFGIVGADDVTSGVELSPGLAAAAGVSYKLNAARTIGVSLEGSYVKGNRLGDNSVLITGNATYTDRNYETSTVSLLVDWCPVGYGNAGFNFSAGPGYDILTASLREYPDGLPFEIKGKGLSVEAKVGYMVPINRTAVIRGVAVHKPLVIITPTMIAKKSNAVGASGSAKANVSGLIGLLSFGF